MKSLTHIHFGTKVPREGIAVANLEMPKLTARDAMVLVNKSGQISENNFFERDIEINLLGDILTYFLDKNGFLLTDKFQGVRPLYYKHILKDQIFIDSDGTADILIIDENGQSVDDNFFTFECGQSTVYHALPPGRVHFVVFPKVDDGNNIVDSQHKELLEAERAFEEAQPGDLDNHGCLKPDTDAYLIEELDGNPNLWRLTLPRPTRYSLRHNDEGILSLSLPNTVQTEPWYVDVNNAVLLTTHIVLKQLLRYHVAEFDIQNFYPFPPVKLVTDRRAREISKGVLDLGHNDIVVTNKTPIDIRIFNANGNVVRALTTDENKAGRTTRGIYWELGAIDSVDTRNGRVSIIEKLNPGEQAIASYYYDVKLYRYTGYNFNPLYNPLALEQKVAVLVRPSVVSCNSTISHVVLGLDDVIISASDSEIAEWLEQGSKTLDDLYTDWLYDPQVSTGNINNYLLLGILTTSIPVAPEDVIVTDARKRGGGIRQGLEHQAISAMPEASHNLDMGHFDGPPEPIQGGVIVYLPEYIKYVLSEEEIRARSARFAPAGSYLVFRYYTSE